MPAGTSRRLACLVVLLVALAGRAQAQECFDYTTTGLRPLGTIETGPGWDIALQDQVLYVAGGARGVAVYDVAVPTAPVLLALIGGLPGEATRVAVNGDELVVVVAGFGLILYDVSSPAAPLFAAVHPVADAHAAVVGGGRVFRADGNWAVVLARGATALLDTASMVLGFDGVQDAAIVGDLLFVPDGSGRLVVGDLAAPGGFAELGICGLAGQAAAVAVAGDRLYAVVDGGLESVDISDPAAPRQEANAQVLPLEAVDLALGSGLAVTLMQDHEGRGRAAIYDLTEPAHPRHTADLVLPGTPTAVAAGNGAAFVARADGDVLVLDLADTTLAPTRPLAAAWLTYASVDLEGGLVYAATREFGLRIIEAASGELVHHDPQSGIWKVDALGSRMLVGQAGATIELVDITDPAQPVALAVLPPSGLPGEAVDFALAPGRAVVRWGARDLVFYDLTSAGNPTVSGSLTLPADAYFPTWLGEDLAVSLLWPMAGIATVTDTRASRPRLADWLPGTGPAFAGTGNLIVAGSGEDLVVVRVDDQAQLEEVSRQGLGFPVVGVAATTGAVYVTGYQRPVCVFGRTDPLLPDPRGSTPLFVTGGEVLASDSQLVFQQDFLITVAPALCASPATAAPVPRTGFVGLAAAPNPFNPLTELRLDMPSTGSGTVRVFDAAGRLVRTLAVDRIFTAGRTVIPWDGRDDAGQAAASGVYFVRARIGAGSAMTKVVLVR